MDADRARINLTDERGPIWIHSALELRDVLVQLHDEYQGRCVTLMIEFYDGRSLLLGVGGPETYVVVREPIQGSEWTREWISVGDPKRTDEVDFIFDGHHTPQPGSSVLPWPVALECACLYFLSGERVREIPWEENRF